MKSKLSSVMNGFQLIKKKKNKKGVVVVPNSQRATTGKEVPRRYQITLKGRKENKTTFVFL